MAQDDHGPVFCINGFFSSMRQSYNRSTTCLVYMLVEWDSASMSWPVFLSNIIGDKDPSLASPLSARGQVYAKWKNLGLTEEPSIRDNAIHAPGSALEGLRERLIWMHNALLYTDPFGSRLLASRFQSATITNWIEKNPNVNPYDMNVLDVMRGKNSMQVLAIANELVAEERRLDGLKAERKIAMAEKECPGSSKNLKLPLHITQRPTGPVGLKMQDEIGSLAKNKSLSIKRSGTKESAFMFTKPHANSPKVIALLKEILEVLELKFYHKERLTQTSSSNKTCSQDTLESLVTTATPHTLERRRASRTRKTMMGPRGSSISRKL